MRKGNDPWAEVHRLREENARLQRQTEQNSHRDEEPSTSEELARLVEEVQESARELHLVRPCKSKPTHENPCHLAEHALRSHPSIALVTMSRPALQGVGV